MILPTGQSDNCAGAIDAPGFILYFLLCFLLYFFIYFRIRTFFTPPIIMSITIKSMTYYAKESK